MVSLSNFQGLFYTSYAVQSTRMKLFRGDRKINMANHSNNKNQKNGHMTKMHHDLIVQRNRSILVGCTSKWIYFLEKIVSLASIARKGSQIFMPQESL